MSIIVRRINRAKWESSSPFPHISADAITLCLKTTQNELSLWEISDSSEIEKAVLALITGSKQDKLSAIDIVYFDISELNKTNLTYVQNASSGDTVISSLKKLHGDLVNLNYQTLGVFSELIYNSIQKEQTKRYTITELAKLLAHATNQNIFDINLMNEKFQLQEAKRIKSILTK